MDEHLTHTRVLMHFIFSLFIENRRIQCCLGESTNPPPQDDIYKRSSLLKTL